MKTINLITIFICLFTSGAQAGKKVDPNPSFQKLIAGATRVVIRDGGDICCVSAKETLKQKVYFEIKDEKKIRELAKNIVFINGAWKNGCDCCGQPGMDWYIGDKRVAITAVKHGYGIMRKSTIAKLTPASKKWLIKWLKEHGMTDDQLK